MRQWTEAIIDKLEQKEALVWVSILASSGSTPRGAGARMLVFEDGHSEGTIGGGAVEYAAQNYARKLLEEKTSGTVGYSLKKDDVASLGMVCGGDVKVYFQYLKGEKELPLFCLLREACLKHEDSWLVRRFEGDQVTAMALFDRRGLHFGEGISERDLEGLLKAGAVYRAGEPSWYAEPVGRAGRVVVFGGGHVSQELVPVLAHVGFSVAVFEDRPEFAKMELFGGATETILGDFKNIEASVTLKEQDYVVIMTRGHQADFEVLSQVLKLPLSYIGCIGSRKKIQATKERLSALGYPDNAYDRVHSPIGLAIRAETPAEIAISIAGELIQHRAEAGDCL
ncbi:MAG: XdhC family protein [Lachnospiraceae bacterium]|nr:XdhC family protein [Lachnospiraceae bacterium]